MKILEIIYSNKNERININEISGKIFGTDLKPYLNCHR
jgi:hypothetical protein